MSDIVRIPKEAAELISELRADGWSDGRIFEAAVKRNFGSRRFDPLSEIPAGTLAKALFIEFEIEQTPEDKVREYCDQLRADHGVWSDGHQSATSPYGYELTGCVRTLNLLGMKLKGVND